MYYQMFKYNILISHVIKLFSLLIRARFEMTLSYTKVIYKIKKENKRIRKNQ